MEFLSALNKGETETSNISVKAKLKPRVWPQECGLVSFVTTSEFIKGNIQLTNLASQNVSRDKGD